MHFQNKGCAKLSHVAQALMLMPVCSVVTTVVENVLSLRKKGWKWSCIQLRSSLRYKSLVLSRRRALGASFGPVGVSGEPQI